MLLFPCFLGTVYACTVYLHDDFIIVGACALWPVFAAIEMYVCVPVCLSLHKQIPVLGGPRLRYLEG